MLLHKIRNIFENSTQNSETKVLYTFWHKDILGLHLRCNACKCVDISPLLDTPRHTLRTKQLFTSC